MPDAPKADASAAGLISTDQAARLLMVTPRYIQRLIAEGHIPRAGRGRVLLVAAVQGYLRFLKEDAKRSASIAADSRVRDARAAEIELRIAEKNRQLVPVEDAAAALDMVLAAARKEFVGLPKRVAKDRPVRRQLGAEVNASFERIERARTRSLSFIESGRETDWLASATGAAK
jgi:excisionase family DNA binding protein